MTADVWINGHLLGNHLNGHTSFQGDLTLYLLPVGVANVIVVQVKHEGVNSRWYWGSGIYRHVWLTPVDPLHIDRWDTYITLPLVPEQATTVFSGDNRLVTGRAIVVYSTNAALYAFGATGRNGQATRYGFSKPDYPDQATHVGGQPGGRYSRWKTPGCIGQPGRS